MTSIEEKQRSASETLPGAMFEFSRQQVLDFLGDEDGEFFGAQNLERYSATSPYEALVDMLDHLEYSAVWLKAAGDIRAYLQQNEVFVVMESYATEKPGASWREDDADAIVENMRERFGDDFGDEDGDDRLSDEEIVELKRRAQELVSWYHEHAQSTQLRYLRSWRLNSGDLLEVLEQLRPEWLDVNWLDDQKGHGYP